MGEIGLQVISNALIGFITGRELKDGDDWDAATLLTGLLQILAGVFRLGGLMRFVSQAVMIGFVNALAILIFLAQLPELNPNLAGVSWQTYALTALGLVVVYGFGRIPKIGNLVPSPLATVVLITLVAVFFGFDVRTVGDMGQLPDSLPVFLLPDVPLNAQTLQIILPYSLSLAAVGLLESLLTANLIDDITHSDSDKKPRMSRARHLLSVKLLVRQLLIQIMIMI